MGGFSLRHIWNQIILSSDKWLLRERELQEAGEQDTAGASVADRECACCLGRGQEMERDPRHTLGVFQKQNRPGTQLWDLERGNDHE